MFIPIEIVTETVRYRTGLLLTVYRCIRMDLRCDLKACYACFSLGSFVLATKVRMGLEPAAAALPGWQVSWHFLLLLLLFVSSRCSRPFRFICKFATFKLHCKLVALRFDSCIYRPDAGSTCPARGV